MDKETEKYVEAMYEMFRTKGWKELLKNLSKSKEECNSVEVTRDNDDLQFRKGQLNIIAFVTSLETQVELMVKEHEENL
tara:strand:- start:293 stop:529 length:237 start_codon:yes stop_codon:yes gene_type:complete